MKKRVPVPRLYRKPKKRLREIDLQETAYNDAAKLCFVEKFEATGMFTLYWYGGEEYVGGDEVVYPITLETTKIMDRMSRLRARVKVKTESYGDIPLDPSLEEILVSGLREIMELEVNDSEYQNKYSKFWIDLKEKLEL